MDPLLLPDRGPPVLDHDDAGPAVARLQVSEHGAVVGAQVVGLGVVTVDQAAHVGAAWS